VDKDQGHNSDYDMFTSTLGSNFMGGMILQVYEYGLIGVDYEGGYYNGYLTEQLDGRRSNFLQGITLVRGESTSAATDVSAPAGLVLFTLSLGFLSRRLRR
jgi:hypothetical protein